MKTLYVLLAASLCFPSLALAQYPDPTGNEGGSEYGRPGERHMNGPPVKENAVITSVDVEGPLQPGDFQKMFAVSDDQVKEYTQVYDSFTVATSEPRETAKHRLEQLGTALGRDSAAVDYYKDRLKELSKILREAQSRFDERMKRLLSKEQQKQYREWRKKQDEAAKTSLPLPSRRRNGR